MVTCDGAEGNEHLVFGRDGVDLELQLVLLQRHAVECAILIDPADVVADRLRPASLLSPQVLASITSLITLWLYISISVSDMRGVEKRVETLNTELVLLLCLSRRDGLLLGELRAVSSENSIPFIIILFASARRDQ